MDEQYLLQCIFCLLMEVFMVYIWTIRKKREIYFRKDNLSCLKNVVYESSFVKEKKNILLYEREKLNLIGGLVLP